MPTNIQAVRGMNDILPPETALWETVEKKLRLAFQSFGYQEIRFPIVEKTELFKRSIGEVTDIVEKEMYTFLDRNEESLSLRPEGTASCVRACIEHGLLHNQTQRLWYGGPYFRHERPQKGRYRQFHQYSAEAFGFAGPDIDAEMIILSATLLEKLNLLPHAHLQINSLGTPATRQAYRQQLVDYLNQHRSSLDEDSLRRLDKNPLRILDSKNPALNDLIKGAPRLIDSLDQASFAHFEDLQANLRAANIEFSVNPALVRGLDYYTKTVFEWVTHELGAQGTICAGGRYDFLVQQLGGRATPAIGFSLGMERALLLLQQQGINPQQPIDVYVISDSEGASRQGLKLSQLLRQKLALNVIFHCGGGSLKNQIKRADKSGACFAVIIGEQELNSNTFSLKSMRTNVPQQSFNQEALLDYLTLHQERSSGE